MAKKYDAVICGAGNSGLAAAIQLALAKKKVLLIDLDQQGNMSKYIGADESMPSIHTLLHGDAAVADAIQHMEYFDAITSDKDLSKADKEFGDADDVFLLADLLDFVKDDYDYIVIDNSPSRNVLLNMAYVAADYIIIPSECDDGSLDGIVAINEDVNRLKNGRISLSHAEFLGIIMTKYEKTVMHEMAKENIDEICQNLNIAPFIMKVRKSIQVSEAKTMKKPILAYAKSGNPSRDYQKIAQKIIEVVEA